MREWPTLATCLYRVVQEALNNVGKHAQATRVQVALGPWPAGALELKVIDDGRGILEQDRCKAQSFGILGMHERVRAQGGSLRVERPVAGGTRVEVRLPLPRAAPASPARSPVSGGAPADPVPQRTARGADGPALPSELDGVALERLVTRSTSLTLQTVIDAMAGNVAVLDGRGVIRFVNGAWAEFAAHNGIQNPQAVGPGADYLGVCRRSAHTGAAAAAACEGLCDVVQGRRDMFRLDYPCHAPHEQRWYRVHATSMSNGDTLVEHFLLASQTVA